MYKVNSGYKSHQYLGVEYLLFLFFHKHLG
jgi:hypothetical protein